MTDPITLPRVVVERLVASWGRDTIAFIVSMDTLRAALAEPPAKWEPATDEQVTEAYISPDIDARWHDFEAGFRAAERWHGITKEDPK